MWDSGKERAQGLSYQFVALPLGGAWKRNYWSHNNLVAGQQTKLALIFSYVHLKSWMLPLKHLQPINTVNSILIKRCFFIYDREVQELPVDIRQSPEVKFAINVHAALNFNNYIRFFKLVKQASFLPACIMHRYYNQVRNHGLRILFSAYSPGGKKTLVCHISLYRASRTLISINMSLFLALLYLRQFSVPQIEYPLRGSSKKGSHVYFLLIVAMVLLLWHHIELLWRQNNIYIKQ